MGSEGSESRNKNFAPWEESVHQGLEATYGLSEMTFPFFAEEDGDSSCLGKDGSHLCSGRLHPLTLELSGLKD